MLLGYVPYKAVLKPLCSIRLGAVQFCVQYNVVQYKVVQYKVVQYMVVQYKVVCSTLFCAVGVRGSQ